MRPIARRPVRSLSVALAALFLPALAVPALAHDEKPSLEVKIRDAEGKGISVSLSEGFLGGLLAKAAGTLDCDRSDTDAQTREMLVFLDRSGDGARYRFTDRSDGDVVVGRRDHGQLTLDVTKRDGKTSHVVLPWAMGECMLGRPTSLQRLLQPGGDGRVVFSVDDEDGGAVRIEARP